MGGGGGGGERKAKQRGRIQAHTRRDNRTDTRVNEENQM